MATVNQLIASKAGEGASYAPIESAAGVAGAGDALSEDDCAVLRDLVNPTYLQHDSIRWVLRAAPPCAALRCSKQPAPPQRSTACMQRMR